MHDQDHPAPDPPSSDQGIDERGDQGGQVDPPRDDPRPDADQGGQVEPFDEGDAGELRLTEDDIAVLEREGLTTAKSIRALKDPAYLAGLCGWEREHATSVMSRANSLRIRELHKTGENDAESEETD